MRTLLVLAPFVATLAAAMASAPAGGTSQEGAADNAPRVELAVEGGKAYEGLPARIFIDVSNPGGTSIEVDPWDLARLPDLVPEATFATPLAKQAAPIKTSDLGIPETVVEGRHNVRLEAYLDDLVTPLTRGTYEFPYVLTMRYRARSAPSSAWQIVKAAGTLKLEIVPATERDVSRFLEGRMRLVRDSVNPQESRRAAGEIARVRGLAALPFLEELKTRGFAAEAAKGLALQRREDSPP